MLHALLLLLLAPSASAEPLHRTLKAAGEVVQMDASWKDADGERQRIVADLPADAMRAAHASAVKFDLAPVYDETAKALRAWAKREGHNVKVSSSKRGISLSIRASSRAKAKAILKEAEQVRDTSLDKALARHNMRRLEGGGVTADHVAIATAASDELTDVARALAGTSDDPRVFADRAIGFVQSIPYKAGGNKGLKQPLRVLDQNKGDCDSKSTLFLALMRAAHPEVPAAIVYIPGHAFVALGLEPRDGDDTSKVDGRTWVLAEPVGPRMERVGWAAGKHRRTMKRKGELVEMPAASVAGAPAGG